jgi:UDP-2,3-diacylglucosamine pyrophosphatase LpxH
MTTTLTNSLPMITADLFIPVRAHESTLGSLRKPASFKAIWISDLHLGTPQCHAERLLELLQMTESESLYFVGDIADGPELKRQRDWDRSHHEVVHAILEKANQGTRVIFMPGSHTALLRRFIGLKLQGVQILDELVHVTAQGKRMLVLHGDRFNRAARGISWPRRAGAGFSPLLQKSLQALSSWREFIGLTGYPAASFRDSRPIESICLRSVEPALTTEARQEELEAVMCSHIPSPDTRDIGGILCCNDGDWTQHQSAIVEDLSGALRVVTWRDIILQADRAALCEALSDEDTCANAWRSLDS